MEHEDLSWIEEVSSDFQKAKTYARGGSYFESGTISAYEFFNFPRLAEMPAGKRQEFLKEQNRVAGKPLSFLPLW